MIGTLILAMSTGGAPEQCRRIHHLADGRVVESTATLDGDGNDGGASASSRGTGSGSSSSSVSSSSSSEGGGSSSSTSSTIVDGVRRSVTVDDRPPKE